MAIALGASQLSDFRDACPILIKSQSTTNLHEDCLRGQVIRAFGCDIAHFEVTARVFISLFRFLINRTSSLQLLQNAVMKFWCWAIEKSTVHARWRSEDGLFGALISRIGWAATLRSLLFVLRAACYSLSHSNSTPNLHWNRSWTLYQRPYRRGAGHYPGPQGNRFSLPLSFSLSS